jgi:hypothetical protein
MKLAREVLIYFNLVISRCSCSKLVKIELKVSSSMVSLSNSFIIFSIETLDC